MRIGGNGGKCRMDSPLDSGREDDIESIPLRGQWEQVEGHQGKGVPEWERKVYVCHRGGKCVGLYP